MARPSLPNSVSVPQPNLFAHGVPQDVLAFPYPVPASDLAVHIVHIGEPFSKSVKPAYQSALSEQLRKVSKTKKDGVSKFALRCLFFRSTRQRIDCDNLLKAVSDAATGVIWQDDAQVSEIFGRLFLASDRPRVEIAIYRILDTSPDPLCAFCGTPFRTYPSVGSTFCSMKCWARSKRVTLECRFCNRSFEIPQSSVRGGRSKGFCSRICASTFYGQQKTKTRGPQLWKCKDCDGPVSKPHYERCRSCNLLHRQEPTSNYWRSRYAVKEDS